MRALLTTPQVLALAGTSTHGQVAENRLNAARAAVPVGDANHAPVAVSDSYEVNENQLLETETPGTEVQQAVVTRLQMTSDEGDWVGDGQSYDFTLADGQFSVYSIWNALTIDFASDSEWWSLNFRAPNSQPLAVGTYSGATRSVGGSPDTPGLDVSVNGRGNGSLTGAFTVKEISFSQTGQLTSLWITFEQYNDGSSAGLHGELQFNTPVAHPAPATTTSSSSDFIPAPANSSGDDSNQTLGNESVVVSQIQMISDAGDYIGGGRSYQYSPQDGIFSAFAFPGHVEIRFLSDTGYWMFDFSSPAGEPLRVGTYTGATRDSFRSPGEPGMDISGNGSGSNQLIGSFTIRELEFAPTGELRRLWMTFEQHSEFAVPALHGVIQYNSLVDTAASKSILANDSDVDGDPISAVLVSLPKHGRVTLNPNGTFLYVPDRNYHGTDKFTYKTTDGRLDSKIATVTLTVKQVNAAPIGKDKTVTTRRNKLYTFKTRDFGFQDPGNKPRHKFAAVLITTPPTRGKLSLHGVTVTAGTSVSYADLKAGRLTFIPDASGPEAVTSSFTFQVQDNGGTADGGVDTDLTPREMTITVV